jgi:hypothetical protein
VRQLAIAILGFWLATSAVAHADNGFTPREKRSFTPGGASFKSPAARPAAPGFGEPGFGAAASKSRAPREFAPIQSPVSPKPIGPQTFKPFKGTSTYDGPSAVKPYKPPKMKSVYDH